MVIEPEALASWVAELLRAHGTEGAKAERVAAALVDADRCGHSSHGVRQLPHYVDLIQSGELAVDAEPLILDRRGGLMVLDGRNGFGQLTGELATDLAIEGAAEHGVSAVAVRNAGHIGRLGAYTERVAAADMAGILLVNFQGGDQIVAPFGASERRVGNNPISIGVPGPAVLDIALSVAAEGRVHQAGERAERLPEGWILDREGNPSTDPGDYLGGGSLLPMGGHKGHGLILMVEMLVGLLTLGGMAGPEEKSFSNAFVLICVDPGERARDEYLRELPVLAEWVKSARRLPGMEEVLIPGEPEARRRAAAHVVDLDETTQAALVRLAREAGIAEPSDRLAKEV
jgi:hydroxycarboxylate dehydrogenase B